MCYTDSTRLSSIQKIYIYGFPIWLPSALSSKLRVYLRQHHTLHRLAWVCQLWDEKKYPQREGLKVKVKAQHGRPSADSSKVVTALVGW